MSTPDSEIVTINGQSYIFMDCCDEEYIPTSMIRNAPIPIKLLVDNLTECVDEEHSIFR